MATILVTGGNRGIGFGVVQAIANRLPDSLVIIGCRSTVAGDEAMTELRELGVKANLDVLLLDIEDDASITAAVATVDQKHGKLDVLINNAAKLEVADSAELSEIRSKTNAVYNNCITSNAIVTQAFLPLLRKAEYPRVIMNSSARGSLTRTASRELPPVSLVDYCVAKAALNMLTLHFQLAEEQRQDGNRVIFWATSPGHCKTAFNNFRGVKDPIDGAEAIVRLLESEKGVTEPGTFWEFEQGEFRMVPW
ncbi:Short-chain dehydrogenase/reductase tropE [Colletotrichum siamense]|uniref:Short-chain dehydrogenase/reductase tropE n=1 Tax=Colletotrichum siamense TaxID=690259 RepID=A0A9P5K4F9_COLSI|nr:Short-chain dehydrogenase/reductase tropE [Colletotrichum siamense]KAF4858812.1 Short-chain dehydrogenase/reductase tropE [Colletotrichum siamense]